jgi:hypothetical protein
MKRNEILRNLDGDQSEWMSYYSELWLHRAEVRGRQPYLPSPAEIEWRCRQLRWLQEQGFCRAFIVNIMEYENPCIERVEQMVARHGAYETYRRCREFMVPTEYDAEQFLGENRYDWSRNARMK